MIFGFTDHSLATLLCDSNVQIDAFASIPGVIGVISVRGNAQVGGSYRYFQSVMVPTVEIGPYE